MSHLWHQGSSGQGLQEGGLSSFASSLGSDQGGSTELGLDSGCNGFMIKEKHLFVDLDESFQSEVRNANGSASAIRGKGTALATMKDKMWSWSLLEPTGYPPTRRV